MTAECSVVIVAGGSGTRFGGDAPKQFLDLCGCPVLVWSAKFFSKQPEVGEIIVVAAPDWLDTASRMILFEELGTPCKFVVGGPRRQDSVANGLAVVDEGVEVIAVHDAARPFPPANFGEAVAVARADGAAIFALPVADTLKLVGEAGEIERTVSRENLWGAQTPQFLRRDIAVRVAEALRNTDVEYTDEAAAVEALGIRVRVVRGERTNFKITTAEDLKLAEEFGTFRGR
ncbi:MAG: 2-C-methyl-D-erythritol 4-phosphate cytidylyltransferase [Candidatus Sumerlaeaceae bacterium]|nr:2-C-methyl-D-erythritol 4-phosphate cytidylyltransferase [Candidatus Sumerlaeaceae bacterium]